MSLLMCLTVTTAPGAGGTEPPPGPAPRAAETARPHVVLITSDDQALTDMRWLPRTRRLLGRKGVTFRNMVAPHPNCCPSRAQILTGQYAHNNGVATNTPPHGGHASLEAGTALPVWLRQAGYRTAFVGKYLHGYDEADPVEPGWDRFRPIVSKPLSRYYGVLQVDDGVVRHHPPHVYHTELVAQQTTDMVAQLADRETPFFLWSSYLAPHGTCATSDASDCSGPPLPSATYRDLRPGARLPSLGSPSYNEGDMSDKPRRMRSKRVSRRVQQRLFTARVRALASLDDAVAGTVAALERAGVLDETLIIFTSDNGYMFGEHRQTGKVLAYEESIRVPLLMRGPGLPEGKSRRQTVAMIDLAPTIARVAHATPLVPVDGVNLMPYAARDARQRDRALLVQAGRKERVGKWYFRGIRTDRYTYVDWPRSTMDELYDRRADPWQLESVLDRPEHQQVRARLAGLLRRLETCSGRACRVHLRVPRRGR